MRSKLTVALVCLFVFTGCSQLSQPFWKNNDSRDIIKSQNDDREYKYLTLKNGLRVLLISDVDTDVAAASLDVFVGSGSDPEHREGLAHFLEHMLFLGTEKYPEPDEYQAFIKENAGTHNAYTSFEHTNYFFNIKPDKLEPALDRFSQFFVSPLLNETYIEREKNAVESEYRARFKDEPRRKQDVLKQIINPDHPFHKFSVGSLQTLSNRDVSIKQDLTRFYNTWYSANNMALVVLGSESLEQLEMMVNQYFNSLSSFKVPDNTIDEPLFDDGYLPKWVQLKPDKQIREITLAFPLPDQVPYYRSKPLALIGHILGHEGEGSLLSWLKKMNLAERVSAGSLVEYKGGTVFAVTIGLTEQGLENQDKVVKATFQAIERLRNNGVPQWVFDEVSEINKLEFQFKENRNPMYYVMGLSNSMHYYDKEYLLFARYVMDDYQPKLIRSILDKLVLSNCLIGVVGDDFEPDKTSPNFEVPYKVSDVDKALQKMIVQVDLSDEIRLPERNTLLPESVSVMKVTSGNPVPEHIVTSEGVDLWYKPVDSFLVPKSNAFYSLQKPGLHQSAKDSTLLALYIALLNDNLNELVYPARMAGLSFELYSHARGVSIKLGGFNDKQDELLDTLMRQIVNAKFTEKQFDRVKTELITAWKNAEKKSPYKKLMSVWSQNMQAHDWSYQSKIKAADQLSLDDVSLFGKNFWSGMSVKALNNGNIGEQAAFSMLQVLSRYLPDITETKTAVHITRLHADAISMVADSDHKDAGYLLYWQGKDNTLLSQAQLMLLGVVQESNFFNQLRTEQQLGYIVFEGYYPLLTVPGIVYVVQSPSASVEKIHSSVLAFLQQSQSRLESMPEEQFLTYKKALIHELREKPKSLSEESNDYWYDLALGVTSFDRKEQLAQVISSLTFSQWQSFVASLPEQLYSRMFLLTTGGQPFDHFKPVNDVKQQPSVQHYTYP